MAGLDTLNITDSGLFNIVKKVANSRTYSKSLITTIGKPTVIDGVASNFSATNYFTHYPLTLEGAEKVTIEFSGTFVDNSSEQYAFELNSTDSQPLNLKFEKTKVTLMYGNITVFSFGNLEIPDDTNIKVFLNLKEKGYEFTLNYGNRILQRVNSLNFNLPISSFTTLTLGSSSTDREKFWFGSINLKEFFIYNNGNLIYAPSVGTEWHFSSIIISDGSSPLTDDMKVEEKKSYRYPIREIKRSGNTILLTCEIPEDAYLTIREVGIYIQTTEGEILFGYIDKLTITKTKDVNYDLIFTINASIGVVNAVGFPEENGIIVKDPDYPTLKNFTTVKEVNTYVLTNLERIIRMNAGAKGSYKNFAITNAQAGIGYNRPQVVYRIQQALEQNEDCYNSVDTFVQLTNKFKELIEEQVDYDEIDIVGDLVVPPNGEVKGFTPNNYITHRNRFSDTSSWELNTSFTSGTDTAGTITAFTNASSTPLELGVQNHECYLSIKGMESINPTALNSSYVRNTSYDASSGSTPYYGWQRVDTESSYYNFHCNNLSVANSPLVEFPQSKIILLEHETGSSSEFTVSLKAIFSDISNTQYLIGKPSNENASFEILLKGGKLQANLYEASTGELITDQLKSRYSLKINRYYNITLSYSEGRYTLSYNIEPLEGEYPDEETLFVYSDRVISLSSENDLVIGRKYLNPESSSLDIDTWTSPTQQINFGSDWTSMASTGTKLFALDFNGFLATSEDGTTWNDTGMILNHGYWTALYYSSRSQQLMALDRYGDILIGDSQGRNWTTGSTLGGGTWYSLCEAFGYNFVALSIHGEVKATQNGQNWTTLGDLSYSKTWISMIPLDGYTAIALSIDGYISHSNGGQSWSEPQYVPNLRYSQSWKTIINTGEMFIALSNDGYLSTSTDGTNWTAASQNLSENELWTSILRTSDKLVALSSIGKISTTTRADFTGSLDFSEFSLVSDNLRWNGASNLEVIYTLNKVPPSNSSLYDDDFYLINGVHSDTYISTNVISAEDLFTVEDNTKYDVSISYSENEGTGTYKVIKNGEEILSEDKTVESNLSNRMDSVNNTLIGRGSTVPFDISKFNIIGNPTITDNGIASNFSSTNNITSSFASVTPSQIILRTKGVYSSTPNTANGSQVFGRIIGTNSSPSIEYNPNGNRLAAIRFHNNSTSSNFSARIIVPLNDGDIVEAEVIATSTSVTLNAKINGVPYTNTWSGNGLYCGAVSGWQASINRDYYWTGSIDLRQCSMEIDGVEIFNGNNGPLPFNAQINLLDWSIKNKGLEWTFNREVEIEDTQLLQYYRTPTLNKNQYSVRDLCNLNKSITFINTRFEGTGDLIDFSNPKGFTLCLKVNLQNAESKAILFKSDLFENIYFSLTFLNQNLEFKLKTGEGEAVLSKTLALAEYAAFTSEPIMLSIIATPDGNGYGYLQMFKNNEAITDPEYISFSTSTDVSTLKLSNYIENMPTYKVTIEDEIVTKVTEPYKYVEDIVVIRGTVSSEELRYINNLFDTNY